MPTTPRYLYCPFCGSGLVEPSDGEELARCPKCSYKQYDNPKPGVGVLLRRGGKFLLVRRANAPGKGKWDIPGGFVTSWEPVEKTIEREIDEELKMRVVKSAYVTSVPDVYGSTGIPTVNLFFIAEAEGAPQPDASEIAEVGWFGLSEIPKDLAFAHQAQLFDFIRRHGL